MRHCAELSKREVLDLLLDYYYYYQNLFITEATFNLLKVFLSHYEYKILAYWTKNDRGIVDFFKLIITDKQDKIVMELLPQDIEQKQYNNLHIKEVLELSKEQLYGE